MSTANKLHQEQFLQAVKSRTKPIHLEIENLTFHINPGVFPPATDTKLLARNIHTKSDETVLDLTTGSGVFAIIAAFQGAKVTAADINPVALANTQGNCHQHGVIVELIQSDLFDNLSQRKFNQIYCNGPFFEGKIQDPLDYACYGTGSFYTRMLSQLKSHLEPKGHCLIVVQNNPAMKFFPSLLLENQLTWKIIDEMWSQDHQRHYQLYRLKI